MYVCQLNLSWKSILFDVFKETITSQVIQLYSLVNSSVLFWIIATGQLDPYCYCHDHPVKCKASMVEVTYCGPNTQRPGQVCCMETKATFSSATVANGTSANKTDGTRQIENNTYHFKDKNVMTGRPNSARNATDILHTQLMDETDYLKSEDNGRFLKADDQMRRNALENRILAGKVTDRVAKGQNNHLFEIQSNAGGRNYRKRNSKSKRGKELDKANEKKKKRRLRQRKRLQRESNRVTHEKDADNVLHNMLKRISDFFKINV